MNHPSLRAIRPLVLVVGAFAAPAQDATTPPPRVAVVPAGPDRLSRLAADRLAITLLGRGLRVVDREQADQLARRNEAIPCSWLGEAATTADARWLRALDADVLVRVNATVDKERDHQGRAIVRDSLRVTAVPAGDASTVFDEVRSQDGISLDGYREAHEKALSALCAPDAQDSLAAALMAALEELHAEEKKHGAPYTVAILANESDRSLLADVAEHLDELPSVQPGSVELTRSGTIIAGKETRHYQELRLRYQGPAHLLRGALHEAVTTRASGSAQAERIVQPAFMTSRRRIEILLRTVEPRLTLSEEIERVANDAVGELYAASRSYLDGKRVLVLPTALPATAAEKARLDTFAQAYWDEHARLDKQVHAQGDNAAVETLDQGPVEIAGILYDSLRQAAAAAEDAFFASRAGSLARDTGRLLGHALAKASESRVQVQSDDLEQTSALHVIKGEAELYREEGAVDPKTVAFLSRNGSQAVVLSSLRTSCKPYQLAISIVDLATGVTIRAQSFLPKELEEELDEEIK